MARRALIACLTTLVPLSAAAEKPAADCSLNGVKLYGKVQVVESFPDLKVEIVSSFPELKVKKVDSFPDLKIKLVESFPGSP